MFRNNKGQSLVEMIIALGIITTGVIGALSLAVSALSSSKESETRIIAANLSREGVEVVRNIRDSNWLAGCPADSDAGVPYDWDNNTDKCYRWDTGLKGGLVTNPNTAIAVFDDTDGSWSLDFEPSDVDSSLAQFYRKDDMYLQGVASPTEDYVSVTFYRIVGLDDICIDDTTKVETIRADCEAGETKIGIDVKSHVRWTEHGREHSLEAIDRLYDWK